MGSFTSSMSSMQPQPSGQSQTGQANSGYPFMASSTPRMAYEASNYLNHSQSSYAAAAAAVAVAQHHQQQQQQQQQPQHNPSPLQQPPRTNSACQYTQLPPVIVGQQQSQHPAQSGTASPSGMYPRHENRNSFFFVIVS